MIYDEIDGQTESPRDELPSAREEESVQVLGDAPSGASSVEAEADEDDLFGDIDWGGNLGQPGSGAKALMEHLKRIQESTADHISEIEESDQNSWYEFVSFKLRSGRKWRTVRIYPWCYASASTFPFDEWRSLERSDGFWSSNRREAFVRIKTTSPVGMTALLRLGGANESEGRISITHDGVESVIEISRPPIELAPLLESRDPERSAGNILRIRNAPLMTTSQVDGIIEKVCDSLGFQMGLQRGFMLYPNVLRQAPSGPSVRRRLGIKSSPLKYPLSSFPHEPMVLYRAGLSRGTPEVLRFWSFYQVLEYFFPEYSQKEALAQVQRMVVNPGFDPHDRKQLAALVAKAGRGARGGASEEDQLKVMLRGVLDPDEILDFIRTSGLEEGLTNPKGASGVLVQMAPEGVLGTIASRIYDIRCRIVHSKSVSIRDETPGLLPGTLDDQRVADDLELVRHISEQALIQNAKPFSMEWRGGDPG